MEYLITAYPSTPTPAMILTPPARAYSPSPSPSPAPEEPQPVASTSKLPPAPSTSRRVLDHILLPRLPAGWLSAPLPGRVSEPVQDEKMCHQCRNQKNLHARYHCGRAGCVRAYCTSCLAKRYAWSPSDIHTQGCPGCRGVCNCSQCLDRAGLGRHKAFLTADARAGGCARKWLAERGLLVEGDGPPPTVAQRKKNMAKRPKILSKPKKQTDEARAVAPKKVKKTTQRNEEEYDDDEDEPRSRGRWIIDASAKLVRRWARERAARGAQVRAGTRRWFVGASPPPRPRARDDAAGAPPVETIDLTLDDEDDALDSLFDAKSADGDARDDKTEDDDAPDSLFDEKTEDEDTPEQDAAPARDDAADDKDDPPALAPASAPEDKDDDKDSLFDGDPGTPAALSPQIAPTSAPIQLPSTPSQLPPSPIHLSITPSQLPPTPIHLPPTPIHLPPASPIVSLPPASPIVSLARSDSYTDALRIDVELAMPGSPAKGAVDVHITFGDAFGGAASASPVAGATVMVGPASPVAARSPVITAQSGLAPASPAATTALARAVPAPASPIAPASRSPARAEPAPPVSHPKSPLASTGPAPQPKTAVSKAASAMFIPRAKPVAKRKRSDEDGADATRLESAKSSAGVLVALGRAGRVTRVREEERDDAVVLVQEKGDAPGKEDDATDEKDDTLAKKDGAQLPARKDDALVQQADATNDKDDAPMQQDSPVAQKGDALLQKDGAAGEKRPREDTALDDARPAKRAALSKETARKPRAASPERDDDYYEGAALSKETARKHRADASIAHGSPALDDDEPPVGRAAPSKQSARASSSRHEDSTIVDGLPTPKPTQTKQDAARPSAADALAQAMRAAYGGGCASSDPASAPVASSSNARAPVASSSSAPAASSSSTRAPASNTKRSKPTVLAQRASLAIALKTPAPAPSAASALAAAYKQAYAARAPSPASTLRSSPTPEKDKSSSVPKPALHDELSTFIGRFDDDNDKDDEEPTPELLPSDLAAQSEGSSRTGPVSPLVVAHRRPPTILALESDAEDGEEEEMPQRRPFVPCNPRRFVGMPLRFVPAPKRPRPRQAVIDLDTEDDEYKDDDDDFGLARRRKRTKLWEQSALVLQQAQGQAHEPIVVLDDSDDSDFQPAPALVKKSAGSGKGKGKSKSFGPGKGKSKPRKLPLSSYIAYSYTPPPPTEPEPETMPEPVFVPDDDTAAAPPASEVWLGAAMAPLSPDLGLTRAVADAWFSAV